MRPLSPQNRLQALSLPEVTTGFEHAVLELSDEKFAGHKLRPGPVINCLVIEFLSWSQEKRREVVSRRLRELENLVASDEPIKLLRLAEPDPPKPKRRKGE